MSIDQARFRQAMGYFASGVTVITTEHEGQRHGVTVSSFTSLSLEPPLVLICLDTSLRTHEAIVGAKGFVVNMLEQRQEHLSRCFASTSDDKFTGIGWRRGQLGLPVLNDVLAVVECRLHSTLPGGDHTIFIGEVQHAEVSEGSPLLYYRRGYRELK